MGDMMARSLIEAVRTFFDTRRRPRPREHAGEAHSSSPAAPMDEARTAYLDAVTWEERRLFFVERAVVARRTRQSAATARASTRASSSAAPRLIRSGAVKKALVRADRRLPRPRARARRLPRRRQLRRAREASATPPGAAGLRRGARVPRVDVLPLRPEGAPRCGAWRRSYELDPTNEAVKTALKEYGRRAKQTADSQVPARREDAARENHDLPRPHPRASRSSTTPSSRRAATRRSSRTSSRSSSRWAGRSPRRPSRPRGMTGVHALSRP